MRTILGGLLGVFLLAGAAMGQPAGLTTAFVGPGTTDNGNKQLVRTRDNFLWLTPFDCPNGYPQCGANAVRAYRANRAGRPTSFTEIDAANAPRGQIRGTAVAIDGEDRLHVTWIDGAGQGRIGYAVFDTAARRWGPQTTLLQTNWVVGDPVFTQGIQGAAIAVDAAGIPHVMMMGRATRNDPIRVWYTNRIGGAWSAPVPIDDQAVPQNPRYSYHPTLAFTARGALLVAWVQGSCTAQRDSTCYTPDGVLYTRLRRPDGVWRPTVTIPDPTYASIDNGPSLMITRDGVRHITFTSAVPGRDNQIRYWYDAGEGWRGDNQPPPQVTHNPVLGPDGSGGIYIYGHREPGGGNFSGFGPGKFFFHKPAGSTTWSPWTLYADGDYDDATSTRWSQFFHHFPRLVDATFWTASTPYRLFVGTLPAAGTATTAR